MTPHHHEFEHVALFHDGPGELATRVGPALREAIAAGHAVLVCLPPDASHHVRSELGDAASVVTYIPADVRYSAPTAAMAMVNEFTTSAMHGGAPAVWSLGALAFDGSPADARWIRYEAAVNDVLKHLPFKGICAYDTTVVPSAILDAARRTHATVDDGDAWTPSGSFTTEVPATPHSSEMLLADLGAADQMLVVDESAVARRAVSGAYRPIAATEHVEDALLAATELVTNALRHGAPPVTLETWRTATGDIVLRVSDGGAGITDPFPELRPPTVGLGGYGLWVVGQLCDEVFVERIDDRTVVTVRLPAPAA